MTITADALLTQGTLARNLVEEPDAHYVATAKTNQPTLMAYLSLLCEGRSEADFREPFTLEPGRLASRPLWTITRLNGYLRFPHSDKPSP